MSGTSAYMPWYIGDYLRDTMHLVAHEHGGYLLLLAHAWQHDGAIPLELDRIRKIARLTLEQWAESEATLMEFWQRNGSAYRQKRTDAELDRAKIRHRQQVDAGKARAAQVANAKRTLGIRSADAKRTFSQSESDSDSDLESKAESKAFAESDLNSKKAKSKALRTPSAKKPRRTPAAKEPGRTMQTATAYSHAYQDRYGVPPLLNKRANGILAAVIDRVGAEEAPHVAAHYVRSNRGLYVSAKHPTNLLLRDAEALRTEWATGTHGTDAQARAQDRGSVDDPFQKIKREQENARNKP